MNIFVERALAKVVAQEKGQGITVVFPEGTTIDGKTPTLTAKIIGWNLSGTNNTSYILKHIDKGWNGNWWKGTNRTFWGVDLRC